MQAVIKPLLEFQLVDFRGHWTAHTLVCVRDRQIEWVALTLLFEWPQHSSLMCRFKVVQWAYLFHYTTLVKSSEIGMDSNPRLLQNGRTNTPCMRTLPNKFGLYQGMLVTEIMVTSVNVYDHWQCALWLIDFQILIPHDSTWVPWYLEVILCCHRWSRVLLSSFHTC